MKKTIIICLLMAVTFTVNAQWDYSDDNKYLALFEVANIDDIKPKMTQLGFTIVSEKSIESQDKLLFKNSEEKKIVFIYENKIIKSIGVNINIVDAESMSKSLLDKGYKKEKEEAKITYTKPKRPYKFVFKENGFFERLLVISIDRSVITEIVNMDNMPPIQMFLDKIAGKEFAYIAGLEKHISQLLTNNSFTGICIYSSSGKTNKEEVKKIDWKYFNHVETYTLKNEEKVIICKFYFDINLNQKSFSNNVEFGNYDKYNYFHCFVLAKDKDALLKVVKDWENSRN